MAFTPKRADLPRVRSALRWYRVASVVTGVMLLLLCVEMVLKYVFHVEVFAFTDDAVVTLAHLEPGLDGGLEDSMTSGVNLSLGVLIVHGWLYVFYLASVFRLWSAMRWPALRFFLLALGGIVPLLSFALERRMGAEVVGVIARVEAEPVPGGVSLS